MTLVPILFLVTFLGIPVETLIGTIGGSAGVSGGGAAGTVVEVFTGTLVFATTFEAALETVR